MLFKDMPIQKKLIRVILLVCGVMLLVTSSAFFSYEFYTFRQTTMQKLLSLGTVIATNSTAALAFENQKDAYDILLALKAQPHIIEASLYDEKGNLFSRYPATADVGNFPVAPGKDEFRFTQSYLEGFQPVVEGNRRLGTLYLKSDLRDMYERFRLYGSITGLVIVLSLFLAYLLSKILQKSISKPILALADTAKKISVSRDFSLRAIKSGNDELGSLTDSFNNMLQQIQEQNNNLRRSNQKLDKSEKFFRAMIEKDTDMKTLAAPDGKVFYASPSLTKILGYENQEFMDLPTLDLIHPDNLPAFLKSISGLVQTSGKSLYRQERLRHKNGTWLWCEGTITNMLHEPAVAAIVTNFRDISERKKSEEQQALYSSIINSTDDAIFSKTLEGVITSWNYGAEKIFGYSPEEILGKSNAIIIPPHRYNEETEIMNKIRNGESVQHYETERTKKDGKNIYVSLTISPIKDSLGTVVGASKILRDISQRKKAEESLRLAEANYREIFNKASDAIYVHEIETGKVIGVNQRASEITGYTEEELLNNNPQEFITDNPDYTLLHAMNYLQKAAAGEPQCFEWLGKNKDQSDNWLEVNLKKATIAGKERILAFFREINDRKRSQLEIQKLTEELEQKVISRTEQLESANKELEAFSYSVSHDLRAPLRAINGFAKMLGENYNKVLDDEGRRLFNRIHINAQKMGVLIDNLLEFSRLGRKEIHKSPLQMTELAESSLLELNAIINHKAAVTIHALHPAEADSAMIQQVMINLLSNAIKYSSKCEAPVIEVKSYAGENEIVYSVSDNGVGFNNQFANKLFGVFQRLHLAADFDGTGVGLALVKRIINKHGGKVWASGELNKGATFSFSLPTTNNN